MNLQTKFEVGQDLAAAIFDLDLRPEARQAWTDLIVASLTRQKAAILAHKNELRKAGICPAATDIRTPHTHLATIAATGALLPTLTPAEAEIITTLVFGLIHGRFSAPTLRAALEIATTPP